METVYVVPIAQRPLVRRVPRGINGNSSIFIELDTTPIAMLQGPAARSFVR